MVPNNYLLLDNCLNKEESDIPLLDGNLLNDLNDHQFEIDNFLTPLISNENDFSSEFISTSQNCSFDSISVESCSNGSGSSQSNDQYNSSASSSTSDYQSEFNSPIQITPPETPPSCESSPHNYRSNVEQLSNVNIVERGVSVSGRSKKLKKTEHDLNKRKKLVPLAPKADAITTIQLKAQNSLTSQIKIVSQINSQPPKPQQQISVNDLLINNNSLNYSLNNQNLNGSAQPISQACQVEEKLSRDELSKIREKARRQRNRQSAQLSRQKKVEYIKGIELRLEELTEENQNLKKQNNVLINIVNKLTFENNQLKNSQNTGVKMSNDFIKHSYPLDNSPAINGKKTNFLINASDANKTKKTVSLLAVIFLIGLNMNLYNDNFKTYSNKKLSIDKQNDPNVFKGRVLLWSDNLDQSIGGLNNSINATITNCNPNLISRNETLILESKLRNWAIHQTSKQQFQSSNKKFNSNFGANKLDDTSTDRKLPWYLRSWNQFDENSRQRELYTPDDEQLNYKQIIESIQPKKDTYYFLSLNPTDRLILPLNFYSNTSTNGLFRPKFSLLIPTLNSQFSLNFTSLRNASSEFKSNSFLQLIEIDFEVINMKPIQIQKHRLRLNSNNRFLHNRRFIRNPLDKTRVQLSNSTLNATGPLKQIKPFLLRNQTVQSQHFNKTIAK